MSSPNTFYCLFCLSSNCLTIIGFSSKHMSFSVDFLPIAIILASKVPDSAL